MISTRDYRNKLYDLEETKLKSIIAGFDVLIEAFRQEYVVQETDPNTKLENIAELIGFYNLLIREGKYEEFKNYFQEECGDNWVDARNDFYFRRDEIIKRLNEEITNDEKEILKLELNQIVLELSKLR